MLKWDWETWGRRKQLAPPGDWATWLVLAGRGWGKTRTGAETLRAWARSFSPLALVAPTAGDARDVMVEGVAGILAVSPRWERPRYEPSKRRLTWPNGAWASVFSADEPDRLRGPQHAKAWCDELAAWKNLREAWDNLSFGMRLGDHPQVVATTTPKPKKLIRELVKDPSVVVTNGTTYENTRNLASSFLSVITRRYEGTTIGLQELYARVLEEAPGALWKRATIQRHLPPMLRAWSNVSRSPLAEWRELPDGTMGLFEPDLVRIVVGVDPNVSSSAHADEAGIVVAGLGGDGQGYVLEDCTVRGGPKVWAARCVDAYERWNADRIVPEVNNGGELVTMTIRAVNPNVAVKGVHASRGKRTRAEPVSALYEQGRVWHTGTFEDLEDELVTWVPEAGADSPDRMDALVWALTELMLGGYDQGVGEGPDLWEDAA